MNDMTTVGPSLSSEESKFFETGGESGIPAETGADAGGGDAPIAEGGTPAADAAAAAAGDQGKGEPKHVPLAALHEERNRRKEIDKQLREAQQKLANFEGRFAVIERLNGGQHQQPEQPAAPPTVDDDIFGNVKHVGETVEQIKKRLDDADAAKKVSEQQTTFVNNYRSDAATFEQKNPDFKAAYNHLLQTRANELIAIGYDDPAQLQAQGATQEEVHAAAKAIHDALTADEFGIVELAFSKKKSPAEILYGLAKQRGYKPADAAGKTQEAPKGAEKLEAIERGQAANKSLSNTGGNAGDQDMTAERLLSMPLDEFEGWVEKNPAKARRIMGG